MNRWAFMLLVLFTARSGRGDSFPLAPTVQAVRAGLAGKSVKPTGLSKRDYLKTIAGIVDFFGHFQNAQGRIIDPFVHREVQYSTPCYAWATAALVTGAHRSDLLERSASALDAALEELTTAKPADGHGDFFTFPAMLAYEALKDRVPVSRRRQWENWLRSMDPKRAYRDLPSRHHGKVHNWNVVALTGEFLRARAGFTKPGFVDHYLSLQLPYFTADGLYQDPHVPMAYDLFPRHFLDAMLALGYRGRYRDRLSELMDRACWTSLLIQSPNGEWPTGGRSAQHQWNEAMECVAYEIWANREEKQGDRAAAQAFERAAHLALQSVRRWIRPSGELWIVKNHFDPAERHGFEGYSFHSQYNLLAASMLATAWRFANDRIAEGLSPSDLGGFVVPLPEFHKIFANARGLYLEIDTGADPHYNSTGLLRIQRRGVEPLVGPSDGSSISRGPLCIGIAWRDGNRWIPLAGYGQPHSPNTDLSIQQASPQHVRFSVNYGLHSSAVDAVVEAYDLTPDRVQVNVSIRGDAKRLQVRFPAFAFDGAHCSTIALDGDTARVEFGGSQELFRVKSPAGVVLRRTGRWISTRNGFVEMVYGDVPGQKVVYTIRPSRLSR